MEHLSKQQIVLLTLLVSFVTSIATGIVAVSLMNQAPPGVTQTINRIVERTVERVVSTGTSTAPSTASAVLSIKDATVSAVESISKSLVRLKPRGSGDEAITGLGLVVSKEGVIVTDKSNLTSGDFAAVFSDGKEFPVQVVQSQILGDIVFVTAIAPREYIFTPVIYPREATSIKLGETVFTLGGRKLPTLSQGFVSSTPLKNENIETSISAKEIIAGSPLFSLDGEVIGMKTFSLLDGSSFYPMSALAPIVPVVSR
jgi:S1-C subfamily serine protease